MNSAVLNLFLPPTLFPSSDTIDIAANMLSQLEAKFIGYMYTYCTGKINNI